MAENEDGQEKSEEPTSKRLNQARDKGQVPRSRELNTMMLMLVGIAMLLLLSRHIGGGLAAVAVESFSYSRAVIFDPLAMIERLAGAIREAFLLVAPFFAAMIVIAIASSIALGGMIFSGESLTPKLGKMNPLKGIKRILSWKGLLELAKALGKFALVGGTTSLLLWNTMDAFIGLSRMEVEQAVGEMVGLIGWSVLLAASTLSLIAAIDVPFQLWDHKRQLKMTRQEVKDEMKETEGRPEVKGRIRQLQRELAYRRMMEEVPKADVIVTNPTHYAVALHYDQERMRAPKVVAKGVELVAANIRRVGDEHRVPIVESPMLARAIYHNTELGDTIPAGLYLAVAKLLAYVFQLRAWREEGGLRPEVPTDLPVPDDLQVPEREGN